MKPTPQGIVVYTDYGTFHYPDATSYATDALGALDIIVDNDSPSDSDRYLASFARGQWNHVAAHGYESRVGFVI